MKKILFFGMVVLSTVNLASAKMNVEQFEKVREVKGLAAAILETQDPETDLAMYLVRNYPGIFNDLRTESRAKSQNEHQYFRSSETSDVNHLLASFVAEFLVGVETMKEAPQRAATIAVGGYDTHWGSPGGVSRNAIEDAARVDDEFEAWDQIGFAWYAAVNAEDGDYEEPILDAARKAIGNSMQDLIVSSAVPWITQILKNIPEQTSEEKGRKAYVLSKLYFRSMMIEDSRYCSFVKFTVYRNVLENLPAHLNYMAVTDVLASYWENPLYKRNPYWEDLRHLVYEMNFLFSTTESKRQRLSGFAPT